MFLVFYAAPLLVAPLTWARWFKWRIPGETDLTVYFGRCLGAVAVAIVFAAFHAASAPAAEQLAVFNVIVLACGLLTLIHVWGAITKTQPWTETVEIVLYAALTVVAFWIRSRIS